MSTSWSEFPMDLLYLILSNLSIRDLFCCAAVCSHWSTVVEKIRRSPGDQRPDQIPWLVPEEQFLINGKYNYRNNYNFFSLADGRVYDIPSPATRILKDVVGSSYGWLITVGTVSVQLLNPITRVRINLPSFPTTTGNGRNLEPIKAVLSSDPSGCADYIVVFVFCCCFTGKDYLFFANAGDKKWQMIDGGDYVYEDIAFHKGKLYAVLRSDEHLEVIMVVAYDLTALESTQTGTTVVVLPHIIPDFDIVFYFLCTSSDDLMLTRTVPKISENHINKNRINKLEVWKVDTEEGAICRMNNLGKYALFLSEASSLCVDTSSLQPDLKSNSIYISIDLYDIGYSGNLVYSMEDESFTSLSLPPLSSRKQRRFSRGWPWRDTVGERYNVLLRTLKRRRPILVWFTPSIALHADSDPL